MKASTKAYIIEMLEDEINTEKNRDDFGGRSESQSAAYEKQKLDSVAELELVLEDFLGLNKELPLPVAGDKRYIRYDFNATPWLVTIVAFENDNNTIVVDTENGLRDYDMRENGFILFPDNPDGVDHYFMVSNDRSSGLVPEESLLSLDDAKNLVKELTEKFSHNDYYITVHTI